MKNSKNWGHILKAMSRLSATELLDMLVLPGSTPMLLSQISKKFENNKVRSFGFFLSLFNHVIISIRMSRPLCLTEWEISSNFYRMSECCPKILTRGCFVCGWRDSRENQTLPSAWPRLLGQHSGTGSSLLRMGEYHQIFKFYNIQLWKIIFIYACVIPRSSIVFCKQLQYNNSYPPSWFLRI